MDDLASQGVEFYQAAARNRLGEAVIASGDGTINVKHRLVTSFPRAARAYKNLKNAVYLGFFRKFPAFASAAHEYRQESHKAHRTSFGMDLVGPRHLVEYCGIEAEGVEFVENALRAIDVFVDVGANVGLYTCLAASKGRRVVAIEPLPSNLRYLYQNIRRNNLEAVVEVFPIGVSSAPGLNVLRGVGAQASFLSNWAQEEFGYNQYVESVCPLSTLDILLGDRFSGQKLLIQIDVEGFEFEVLQGAISTLGMSPKPTWILECFLEKHFPGNSNPNFVRTFELLFDHGYTAKVASVGGARVTRQTVGKWAKQGTVEDCAYNFIFEHTGSDLSELAADDATRQPDSTSSKRWR